MIAVSNLTLRLGDFALEQVSFEVPTGCYAVLMGKTGCGKTSVLEAICGLRPIVSGTIHLANQEVTQLKPAARGIGYVPQDGALFETMTVEQNLGFALDVRRVDAETIRARVQELARLLEIEPLLNRYPKFLSGGERQRVALGRALAFHPKVLLLDEPLSALDDETRHHLYEVLQRIRAHFEVTALHVTHSREEARELADRVIRIEDGKAVTFTDVAKLPQLAQKEREPSFDN